MLSGVSVDIQKGEFVSVMSPSGSEKLTLLYVLNRMDTIDQGNVQFMEQELTACKETELADLRRPHMGFVFQ
ncbi:hypothetical protein NRIC_09920 [Enterococcus florum]|uniref:ABC transporter domain-containing protein n=1 Tax=Enterococcus florum TaxID=2480627 RepID=A0A4P5PA51_9ENTE|nr:ATP-binding cassette domain-containing protein [Enterococcus florum]GCF93101.1 hypothetical protein NRIC_09920 [Enterococcus florum]